MADGLLVERLRRYLNELHPNARALLMAELERGVLRGEDMPGAELVLRELRRDARENARPKRPGNLARLFFQPLEPFWSTISRPIVIRDGSRASPSSRSGNGSAAT